MKRRTFLASASVATGALFTPSLVLADSFDDQMPDYNMPEEFAPREVRIKANIEPYEIHVDPGQTALYWTLPNRKAIRYAVGIGRRGLYEDGEFYVGRKAEWPRWTPTPAMIRREPEVYEKWADGMPGGLTNPLGARALYLYQPGRGDTMLRIHGTHLPGTIGRQVSNGCARLINPQMIELYNLVPINTRVVLYPLPAPGHTVPTA